MSAYSTEWINYKIGRWLLCRDWSIESIIKLLRDRDAFIQHNEYVIESSRLDWPSATCKSRWFCGNGRCHMNDAELQEAHRIVSAVHCSPINICFIPPPPLFCFIYRYDRTAWCQFGSWNILTCTCLARAAEIRAIIVFFFAHSFIHSITSVAFGMSCVSFKSIEIIQ